jgi:hypothetical protein
LLSNVIVSYRSQQNIAFVQLEEHDCRFLESE